MPALKIGLQLASLWLPLKKALVAAARLGATAVEIDARDPLKPLELSETGLRDLRRWLEDLNLKVAAVAFQTRRGYDVPDELEARVAGTKKALTFARAVRSSVVVNQVGHVPAEPKGRGWDLLTAALSDLGAHGDRVGATLAARTGAESGDDLARLIAALPAGSLGVDLDPGNLIINGFSAIEAATTLGPHVLHVHARDAVRDLARGRGLETPLGQGSADFPSLLATLEERGYRGYITLAREHSPAPEEEFAAGIEYLKSL